MTMDQTPVEAPHPAQAQSKSSFGLDISAAVLLLVAAYLLSGTEGYHRYSYYQTLRIVVCAAWVLAAVRFYYFKWFPVAILGALVAWLFNPIFPVTMRKWEWQPYDHWTMLLSIAAAGTLVIVSIRSQKR